MPKGPATLSPREKAFVRAYTGSAGADPMVAALHAGYEGTPHQLRIKGHSLLRKIRVRHAIDRRIGRTLPGPGAISKEVSDIALAPWKEFVEIEMDDGKVVSVKVKLSDKLRAAELMMKSQGQLTDPAARMFDVLMRREIVHLLQAQREGDRKKLRMAKRAERSRARQLALPAGSPGGAALDLHREEEREVEELEVEERAAAGGGGKARRLPAKALASYR